MIEEKSENTKKPSKIERVELNSDEAVERNEESCFEGQAVVESESQ